MQNKAVHPFSSSTYLHVIRNLSDLIRGPISSRQLSSQEGLAETLKDTDRTKKEEKKKQPPGFKLWPGL